MPIKIVHIVRTGPNFIPKRSNVVLYRTLEFLIQLKKKNFMPKILNSVLNRTLGFLTKF